MKATTVKTVRTINYGKHRLRNGAKLEINYFSAPACLALGISPKGGVYHFNASEIRELILELEGIAEALEQDTFVL